MKKHLVLVGGGHAHLTALLHCRSYIDRGHRVTLVSPDAYHYYSGMGPGMLAGIYRPQDIRFNIKKMAEDRGAVFLMDAAMQIHPGQRTIRLQSGRSLSYDIASFNTGSGVPAEPLDGAGENVFTVKPIVNLLKARLRILELLPSRAPAVVVIGGGPAGVEITANIWRLIKDGSGRPPITLVAGTRLLKGLPDRAGSLAKRSFGQRGIAVIEGARAVKIEGGSVLLSDGRALPFDLAFVASGVRPSPLFKHSGLPVADDGGLLVNEYLQSVAYPELYGGGDCISLQGHRLARVGVYAVRQNDILRHNLMAALEGGSGRRFEPQKTYLLIFNMGDGTGLLLKHNFVYKGRLAFRLKDYIDTKFMKTFQVSGERDEK